MGTTAAGRAGLQLAESSFLIGSLVVVLEWALPVLQHRTLDMRELTFACVFGMLIVIAQTIVAYLRPASKAELVQQIEGILYEEERLRTSPASPRTDFLQLKQWAKDDPTWAAVTTPGLPALPRTDSAQRKQWARENPTWTVTTPGMPAMPPRH